MNTALIEEAVRLSERFGVFPVDAEKRPCSSLWDRRANESRHNDVRSVPTGIERARQWFSAADVHGIGVWCGGAENGWLQCIDFDDPASVAPFVQSARDHDLSQVLKAGASASTRNGKHLWFSVPDADHSNLKLAQFAEKRFSKERNKTILTKIETRGNGGYAIVAPSPGYAWGQGSLLTLRPISVDDFDNLLMIARLQDEKPKESIPQPKAPRPNDSADGERPGDWFNRTQDWRLLLEGVGATYIRSHGNRDYYRRPDKARGHQSATTGNGNAGQDLLKIHSSNWAPFDEGEVISKFAFFAKVEHNGDLTEAAKAISKRSDYKQANPSRRKKEGQSSSAPSPALVAEIEGMEPSGEVETIDLTKTHPAEAIDRCWAELLRANDPPTLYRFQGRIVEVIVGTDQRVELVPQSPDRLQTRLSYAFRWRNKNGPTQCPESVAKGILNRFPPYESLPELKLQAACPLLVNVGGRISLIREPGYDPASGVFIAPYDIVKFTGTGKEAAEYLMRELYGEFPIDQAGKANVLSLIMSTFSRKAITDSTPLFAFTAPAAGSGKTKAARVASKIAHATVASTSMPRGEKQQKEMITSSIASGVPVLIIDNVKGHVDSPVIEAAITEVNWLDRELYTQRMVTYENNTIIVMTGNDAQFSPDLAQRSVFIHIDPQVENPDEREFKRKNLEEWAMENRPDLMGAAIAMIETWIAAGRPLSSKLHGRFPVWSGIVGGILDSCGVEGFLTNADQQKSEADPKKAAWRNFVEEWWVRFRHEPKTAYQLLSIIDGLGEDMARFIYNLNAKEASVSLGSSLSRRKLPVGSHRIEKLQYLDADRKALYRLTSLSGPPPSDEPYDPVADQGGFEEFDED